MTIILDGRALAGRIQEKVKQRVAQMTTSPGLAVILVGDNPASHLYVSLKRKACEEAGIRFEQFLYPANEAEAIIVSKVEELNGRDDVTGILVQLPLPNQDADRVIRAIHPNKDVDGFHKENLRALADGRPGIVPALAVGIMKLVEEAKRQRGQEAQRTAVIVGSEIFAEPLRYLFAEQGVFAARVDPDDTELAAKTKTADMLVVAVGRPGFVTGDMVKPGAIIIDVGTTRTADKTVGDVDTESVLPVAGAISPVPGGVGPMTVAMLLLNVLKAAEMQQRVK
jgi:methylenetetrahydrofolate dehydrogenase (NADP+)/methenyltetrahydrofolate cyclohydrolase